MRVVERARGRGASASWSPRSTESRTRPVVRTHERAVTGCARALRSAPRCAGPARRWRGGRGDARLAVEGDRRLALVGDAERDDLVAVARARGWRPRAASRRPARRSRWGRARPRRGRGSTGSVRGRSVSTTLGALVEGDRAHPGGPGVEGENEFHRRQASEVAVLVTGLDRWVERNC